MSGDRPESRAIRRLLTDQIEEIWGKGRTDLVDANYAVSIADHMPVPGQPSGREALKDVVDQFRAGIADMSMDLHATLVAGDFGVDVWTLSGTHSGDLIGVPATGNRLSISGIDMVRVEQGRISDLWHVEEMAQLMDQMGAGTLDIGKPKGLPAEPAAHAGPGPDAGPGADAIVPGEARFTPRERRNLAIARRHIEELWAGGKVELAHEIYHPQVVDHNMAPGQKPGIKGILDVLRWLREAVTDLAMRIECYVIDGDMACDRWTMSGTHTGALLMGVAPSGKRFSINGMDVIRIDEDGLVTDVWHAEEFARLLAQLSG
ncbi:ester cyclase [Erythrobacter sp.]|jgi:predicted ester cyclase|uniref:ester cyclase n=1 Tax=Erythrobacter sp. TaxID=1042 RepID=UPI002EBAC586|nr:ester cyclase family protein [Erythrobacter sp.]